MPSIIQTTILALLLFASVLEAKQQETLEFRLSREINSTQCISRLSRLSFFDSSSFHLKEVERSNIAESMKYQKPDFSPSQTPFQEQQPFFPKAIFSYHYIRDTQGPGHSLINSFDAQLFLSADKVKRGEQHFGPFIHAYSEIGITDPGMPLPGGILPLVPSLFEDLEEILVLDGLRERAFIRLGFVPGIYYKPSFLPFQMLWKFGIGFATEQNLIPRETNANALRFYTAFGLTEFSWFRPEFSFATEIFEKNGAGKPLNEAGFTLTFAAPSYAPIGLNLGYRYQQAEYYKLNAWMLGFNIIF